MDLFSTIAAIASPPGVGAIGVLRLSGPDAFAIAGAVFVARSGERLADIPGYTARLGDVYAADGTLLDACIALVYHAPKSYTGEDAVEFMCHGGEAVCASILRALLDAGASPAAPGEFTRRAILCGHLTLTEAEAVQDIIYASSRQGVAAAAALQGGLLYRKTESLKTGILSLQAHIAAAVDFPEEDVEPMDISLLCESLKNLQQDLTGLVSSYEMGGNVLRGVSTAIIGSPNVGKSTLLNLLAGAEKSIVTPIAGTTRDIVEQTVRLGNTTLLLADTAGIRLGGDTVEQIGIDRALDRARTASLMLVVFDASRPLDEDDRRAMRLADGKPALAVINKTDLPTLLETAEIAAQFRHVVYINALDPASLATLDASISEITGVSHFDANQPVLANERQRNCAVKALEAVSLACGACENSTVDVVYALLSDALQALAELSGEQMTEALLDEVFSRFCVGK